MKREHFILLILLVSHYTSHAQTCNAHVGGYIPSWRDPATVDYSKLTDVFYAFATPNAAGEIMVDNPGIFEVFKSASVGKDRYLSLGGGGDNSFTAMANSATARQAFAGNCVAFCQTHNLQGIDIDWEGIQTTQDSSHYGALMRGLGTALHANNMKLIATVAYGSYGGDYYNVGALKIADWIQLMVYDQTGTWADSPYGNHSTFQHMLDAISYWSGRGYTDLSSIVIGLPFYGYKFNSTMGGLATALSYSEIVNSYPGLSCQQDEVNLTVFNSPETIRKKVRYVLSHGLKGVMIWEMGQDLNSNNDKSLLKAVSQAVCDLPAVCTQVITGLDDKTSEESVSFFPIPVNNVLNISLGQPDIVVDRIDLINNLGQVISKKEIFSQNPVETINFANVAPGISYIRVALHDKQAIVKRVIKNDQ